MVEILFLDISLLSDLKENERESPLNIEDLSVCLRARRVLAKFSTLPNTLIYFILKRHILIFYFFPAFTLDSIDFLT